MKKIQKVKQFIADHDEAFFLAGTIIVSSAVYGVFLAALQKSLKDQKEIGEWTAEQNFAGKAVYQLADGSYIAVSKEQVS